jgi:cytochrome c biogenesis protein CcmG, thiol:disulfide interchange protein DsbE
MKRISQVLQIGILGMLCAMLSAAGAGEVGQLAPAITLPGLHGETSLATLKDKVVLVDFWASWCVPCRQSFPWLNQMQAKYGARGLQVVGVNVDAQRADAETFLAEVPVQFLIGFDAAGDTPKRYAVKGMPTSVLVGADGRVLKQHAGFREDDKGPLEAAIVAALAKAGR